MPPERHAYHDDIDEIVSDLSSHYTIEPISKETAEEKLGLSWTNVAHVYPDVGITVGQLRTVMNALKSKGYVAVLTRENRIRIEVNITYDVSERLQD